MSGPCRHASLCTRNALPMAELCAEHQAAADAEDQREAARALELQGPDLARTEVRDSLRLIASEFDAAADAAADAEDRELAPALYGERGRRLYASTAPRVLDQEALLPFEAHHGRTWIASPQKPFKPRGLMLWDVPASLNVEAIIIGCNHQVLVAYGKVPALWFQQAQSFEQVVAARAAGQEPSSWGSWDALHPGVTVRLEFDAPAYGVRAVMWGHST